MESNALLTAVTNGLTTVISWVGNVVDALVTTDGELSALLPLLAIGVAVSAMMLGRLNAEGKSSKIGEGCDANTEVSCMIA